MTERMLVLRLSALGDVAMTLPAVYSLARTYPKLTVVFVTENRFLDLIVDAPANLKVIGVDRESRCCRRSAQCAQNMDCRRLSQIYRQTRGYGRQNAP